MRKIPILWGLFGSALLLLSSLFLRPTRATPTTLSRLRLPVTVRSLPEYRNAEVAYARGDRFVAHRALLGLLRRPDLTESDRAFLGHQLTLTAPKTRTPSATKPHSQTTPVSDCGPRALALACQKLGVQVDLATLTQRAGTTKTGTTLEGLQRAAESVGLKTEGVQVDADALRHVPLPAIAWLNGNHFVAVLDMGTTATIHDPNNTAQTQLPVPDLLARSGGILLTLRR